MLLTYPENCVIETCGVVIPSTAGVSCKEPLMRPPINKLFWTVTMAEETKREMIYYYILHTVQGSHNPVFRLFFQKVKASWLFWSRSPMKKNYLTLFGFLFFSSQFETYPIFTFLLPHSRYIIYYLSSLKIYVTLWRHVPKALETEISEYLCNL